MNNYDLQAAEGDDGFGDAPLSPRKSTAFSSKITGILSAPFSDSELREALKTLDERRIENSAESRRRLRLDAQKDLIECNGDVIKDFGQVAEVRSFCTPRTAQAEDDHSN